MGREYTGMEEMGVWGKVWNICRQMELLARYALPVRTLGIGAIGATSRVVLCAVFRRRIGLPRGFEKSSIRLG